MRDPSHMESVERWANYIRNNPNEWKAQHTAFINAQFEKHRQAIERIKASPNGREKLVTLYTISNLKGYESALN